MDRAEIKAETIYQPTAQRTDFPEEALHASVADRFETVVNLNSDRLAVKSGAATLTYAELNAWANRLAHAIVARRGRGEESVGLLLSSGVGIPVGMFGVIKSGKSYVALNRTDPPERLMAVIRDCEASLLVADAQTYADACQLATGDAGLEVVNLDDLPPDLPVENPGVGIDPQTPIFRYYTSGTTGQPKGIIGTHYQLLFATRHVMNLLGEFHEDRYAQVLTYSFAAARKPYFDALLSGGSIHLFDVRTQGIDGLAEWLVEEQITVYLSTASLFRYFASSLTSDLRHSHVRLIILSSDATLRRDFELYQRYFPDDCQLVNLYGSTETGLICSYIMNKQTRVDSGTIPVGYPSRDNVVTLLDESGQPVPTGEIGEIVLSGPYLLRNLQRGPSSGSALIRTTADGERRYHTGDLGRWLPGGLLEYLGRRDFQVKIRGHRVEPAEVEVALLTHDAIRFVAVLPFTPPVDDSRPASETETRLAAYYVAERALPVRELRTFLAEKVPDYMMPLAFMPVDQIPLTANAKLDRAALPAPDWSRVERATPLVQPRTLTEKRLAGRWGQVLGIDKFSIHDRFYDLGGSSLMAAQMLTLVGRDVGRTLSLALLEKHGTLAEFAAFLDQSTPRTSTRYSPLIAIRSEGRRPPLFCFPARQGFVTNFFLLARYLDAEQPVYAFQQRGLDGQDEPNRTLDEMVTEFMGHIRRVQPHGPYYLCGRSFGGVVAYETAQRLVAAGEQVGCVVLFDSAFPSLVRRRTDGTYPMFVLRTAFRALRALTGPPATWRGRWKDLYRRWKRRTRYTFSRGAEERIYRLNASFYRQYRVEPYPGRLTFFTALPDRRPDEREARWQAMARGGFELVKVPGGHSGMLHEPHIRVTGQRLEECLLAAQRQYRAQSETNPESTPDASHMSGIGRES